MKTDPAKPALLLFYGPREEFLTHALEAFDELEKCRPDGVDYIRVEVSPGSKLATTFHIGDTPTLIAFLDGKELWRRTGLFSPDDVPVTRLERGISYEE